MPSPAYALLLQAAFPLLQGLLKQAADHAAAGEHSQANDALQVTLTLGQVFAQALGQIYAPPPPPAPPAQTP